MKAAFIRQTGTPSVIEFGDLPTPEPRPTEVLVKVGAVAVNPIDTYIRAGIVSMISQYPYIVGSDLAGTGGCDALLAVAASHLPRTAPPTDPA